MAIFVVSKGGGIVRVIPGQNDKDLSEIASWRRAAIADNDKGIVNVEIGFLFVGVPVVKTTLIGGPFDGEEIVLLPGQPVVIERPSEAGPWVHYYGLADGKMEHLGRSDGIAKEVKDATGV